jgi:methylated-DNA-protein-cysteine methyltransferase-like protein
MTLDKLRRAVWKIPKCKVATYGEVARGAGFPGAARQVVWALRNVKGGLPWHRVVGAGGRIRLPGEAGLDQRLRLQSEGVTFQGEIIKMSLHEYRFGRAKKTK